jgi:methyl-accepting chemotaxis protein
VVQIIQQTSATAEESAASSEEMSGQADLLENLIAQFRLK